MVCTRSSTAGSNARSARFLLPIAGALSLLGFEFDARADWADDFDAGFAESWVFGAVDDAGDPPATGTSTFSIIEAGADDYLLISHSTTAFPDGGGGATDGFGFVAESFTDVAISADVNAAPAQGQQNLMGVLARGDALTGDAYLAVVDFANSAFAIARSDDLADFLVPLAIDDTVAIDPGETYRVQLYALGTNLTARLIETSTGETLSLITSSDSLYTSGFAGILVETEYDALDVPVGPILGTFDDVLAVPEPASATAVLCGFGATLLLGRRRVTGRSRSTRARSARASVAGRGSPS